MITAEQLRSLLPDYLARQRWFAGEVPDTVEIVEFEVVRAEAPGLVWALARVPGDIGAYQVLVGIRPLLATERFLEGKGRGFLGDVETPEGPCLAYDALVDPDLAPIVLELTAPGTTAETVRPMAVEQSNTSVVFDDKVILKVFRRVYDEPNPDAEVIDTLAARGYPCVPDPVGTWRRGGRDLAVARAYLPGGSDGWQLAMTSLRDLYDSRFEPALAGGDFGPEAVRLGGLIGSMHVALADAFGTEPGDVDEWVDLLRQAPGNDAAGTIPLAPYERLLAVKDPGMALRVHGDLHLGQVLRTDAGWYVLDFEGEPLVPVSERRRKSSPLRDVAGMLRSFQYATEVALLERQTVEDAELRALAEQWERRATEKFLAGYLAVDGIDELLPADDADRVAVTAAFELAKALYEIRYEEAHRPDWADIPRRAVERLTT